MHEPDQEEVAERRRGFQCPNVAEVEKIEPAGILYRKKKKKHTYGTMAEHRNKNQNKNELHVCSVQRIVFVVLLCVQKLVRRARP